MSHHDPAITALTGPCLSPLRALQVVAAAFGRSRGEATEWDLDDLARRLFALRSPDGGTAARAVGALLTSEPGFTLAESDPDHLLLDPVLERRTGHPLPVTAALVEAGRRAGLPLGVCSAPDGWYAGLFDGEKLWLVDIAQRVGGEPPQTVRRHCGHELAYASLLGLERCFAHHGDVSACARARGLREAMAVKQGPVACANTGHDPLHGLWSAS